MKGKRKKIYNKYKNGQKGQAAFFIVFTVMSLLFFISIFLTNVLIKQTKSSSNTLNSVQAYYLADMGTERILWGIRRPASDPQKIDIDDYSDTPPGDEIMSTNVMDIGSFTVKRIYVSAPVTMGIKVTGVRRDVSRAIQISWN